MNWVTWVVLMFAFFGVISFIWVTFEMAWNWAYGDPEKIGHEAYRITYADRYGNWSRVNFSGRIYGFDQRISMRGVGMTFEKYEDDKWVDV